MATMIETTEALPMLVHLRPPFEMTDELFEEFCRLNEDLRIEMTAEGDLIIMPPTGARTGNRNFKLTQQVANWSDKDGTGVGFDSSTLFKLPNGARRSPDVSWVRKSRLAQFAEKEKEKFLPLCPNFVIKLRSASDSLTQLQAKMREYIEQGAQLGWLIDPLTRTVYVYRADGSTEQLDNAETLVGDSAMPNFTLNLQPIWEADF